MSTNNMSTSNCAFSCMNYVWLFLWPIFSMILGIVFGTLFGLGMTLVIFFVTLVRTPMHVYQMLKVTATTQECFPGHWMVHGPLRIAVFCLVPVPHALFLVLVTLFAGTVGVLYYIGKTTKTFYTHDYQKTIQRLESNVKLEPTSRLMKYIKRCQYYMENDSQSYPTIGILKVCCAGVPGIIFGILPLIPFVVAIVGLTLYHMPINIYKTMRIAFFTVLLEWDLRILALVTIPLFHLVVFPLVVSVTALLVGYSMFTFLPCANLYNGKNPFEAWSFFRQGIEYWIEIQNAWSTTADAFDHPSGIPDGWRGNSYGLPVRVLLEWQWKFLVCCVLVLLYGLPICVGGTALLLVVKFIPSCGCEWYNLTVERCCGAQSSLAAILGTWPFYVAEIIFFPLGILLWFVGLIIVSPFWVYRLPSVYLEHYDQPNGSLLAALYEPIVILLEFDELTGCQFCKGWRVFSTCAGPSRDFRNRYLEPPSNTPSFSSSSSAPHHRRRQQDEPNASLYWDRFVEQCIIAATNLRRRGWISRESMSNMDPSVIQSIPAVAILQILVASVRHEQNEKNAKHVIVWPPPRDSKQRKKHSSSQHYHPNGSNDARASEEYDPEDPRSRAREEESNNNDRVVVCHPNNVRNLIRQGDGIAAQLWPLILDIKRLLHHSGADQQGWWTRIINYWWCSCTAVEEPNSGWLTSEENIERLTALLCANQAETPPALQQFLKDHTITTTTNPTSLAQNEEDPASFYDESINNQVRTQINELVLSILRVRPYQDRMRKIFQHQYDKEAREKKLGPNISCTVSSWLEGFWASLRSNL